MAFEAYDDYEQSERVQQWLRQNGASIIVGIVLGLLLIFGWQQWRSHQATKKVEAADLYQSIQQATKAGQNSQADKLTDQMLKDYDASTYAVFAAGLRAQRQVDAGDLGKAVDSLRWAETHAAEGPLKSLMTVRIARVELAAGKSREALAALDRVPAGDYKGIVEELRGDTLVKLGRNDEARKAYQAALSTYDEGTPQRGTVQVKLDNLAPAGKQGA